MLSKIKKYKYIIIGGIIIVVLYVCSLWSDRKDLYDNGKQLTQLETNLTKLKEQNKILQEQLQVSQKQVQNLKTQSEQLQKQVQTLNQSLTNANQLLTRYEKQINEEKNCAIGLGIGNNGIAIAGDIKNTWIIADEKTVILGYKFKF